MTKDQLQKELLEKVKPGTKPSHLKRSKSLNDIASPESRAFPKVPPLPKSEIELLKKANKELKQQLAQAQEENQNTQEKLKELHEFAKSSSSSSTKPTQALNTLTQEIQKASELTILLQEQLKAKQQEIESLRKQLELAQTPNPDLTELDHSLNARHQSLKDWFKQYQKSKQLDQELTENVQQASEELIAQDQTITKLRTENFKLKQTNQNLEKDLNLTYKLVEFRKNSPFPDYPNPDYLKYALYACGAIWIVIVLLKAQKANALTLKSNLNQE